MSIIVVRIMAIFPKYLLTMCYIFLAVTVFGLHEIKIGVILPEYGKQPFVYTKTGSAIEYAVENIMDDPNLLPNHYFTINFKDSRCSETYGPLAAIDMVVNKSAHVFVGPGCDYAVAPVARFSFHWNIPVISAAALVSAFSDKQEYRLLTRISGSYVKVGEFFIQIFNKFNWRKSGLIFYDAEGNANKGRSPCYFTMEGLFVAFTDKKNAKLGFTKPWHKSFDNTRENVDFTEILKESALHTRGAYLLIQLTPMSRFL